MRQKMCLGNGDDVMCMAKTAIRDMIMNQCEQVLTKAFTFSSSTQRLHRPPTIFYYTPLRSHTANLPRPCVAWLTSPAPIWRPLRGTFSLALQPILGQNRSRLDQHDGHEGPGRAAASASFVDAPYWSHSNFTEDLPGVCFMSKSHIRGLRAG